MAFSMATMASLQLPHNPLYVCMCVGSFVVRYTICNGYAMDTSGLPDIYTQSLRAEGVYIRQATSAHGITNIYVTGPAKINHLSANYT